MKNIIVVVIFIFLSLPAKSQQNELTRTLAVERPGKRHTVTYVFKPGKKLYIKTKEGFSVKTNNYSLLEDALILSNIDTINFNEIARIKGFIHIHAGRKFAGAVISFFSIPAAGMAGFLADLSSISPVLGALPFVATFFIGVNMIIPIRSFDAADGWTLISKYR